MSDLTSRVGALTTSFTPTVTSCSSVYIQDNSAGTYFLKFGTVGSASTSSCFPPNFAPLGYYSPGVCSSGYWYACEAGIDKTATVATCCPENYSCKKDRSTDDWHQCHSGFDRASYISVSQCYTKHGTPELPCGRFVTTSYTSGDHTFAYGINVRRASGDPVWSGEPDGPSVLSTTAASGPTRSSSGAPTRTGGSSDKSDAGIPPPSSASSSPGEAGVLSSAAKVDIGVGVTLGALLIIGSIAAAYCIGKRSRRRREEEVEARRQADASHQEVIGQKWTATQQVAELPPSGYEGSRAYGSSEGIVAANYYNQIFGGSNSWPWAYELGPSERSPVEMGSTDPSSELASHWQTTVRELDASPRPMTHRPHKE
ncbi:hypothetical protein PG991_011895 [Apiospora marii]|uniref:Uncharacterized protein n=1 Tax=Apiospora marii TaxID=335849 RepID=A0ABR1RFH5_9PEZI